MIGYAIAVVRHYYCIPTGSYYGVGVDLEIYR